MVLLKYLINKILVTTDKSKKVIKQNRNTNTESNDTALFNLSTSSRYLYNIIIYIKKKQINLVFLNQIHHSHWTTGDNENRLKGKSTDNTSALQ
jgi:Iap family predicted aminopeptidase